MTNVLRTFWSDWFIYFREGSTAAAGGGGERERGGGREKKGGRMENREEQAKSCSETSHQLQGTGTATLYYQKPEKEQSQAGSKKEKTYKDRQYSFSRVKVA